MPTNLIELDGAAGEGGGQILRSALALAMCTGHPVLLDRIRARRPKPGLMRQHLACLKAAVAVCRGQAQGAQLGSTTLLFEPGPVQPGGHTFSVGNAGSTGLVLQTVLPALMTAGAPSHVRVEGGTHNPMAPPFHFLHGSFAPVVQRLGVGLDLTLRRLGFYPAGGGVLHARVTPPPDGLKPYDLTRRGAMRSARARCLAPGLSRDIPRRELQVLAQALGWPKERFDVLPTRRDEGPGNALMATLEYENVTEVVTAFGTKGVRSQAVAHQAADAVLAYRAGTGALGPHLADQWMVPMALAVAASSRGAEATCTEVTGHTTTNAQVIEAFLPVRFTIEQEAPGRWRMAVDPVA